MGDRRCELLVGDLDAVHAGATGAQLADERPTPAADVDDVPAGRLEEPLEHRQIGRLRSGAHAAPDAPEVPDASEAPEATPRRALSKHARIA